MAMFNFLSNLLELSNEHFGLVSHHKPKSFLKRHLQGRVLAPKMLSNPYLVQCLCEVTQFMVSLHDLLASSHVLSFSSIVNSRMKFVQDKAIKLDLLTHWNFEIHEI